MLEQIAFQPYRIADLLPALNAALFRSTEADLVLRVVDSAANL
jgi:hypothetical protein